MDWQWLCDKITGQHSCEGYPMRQPKTVKFPHFLPEEDMQDILAPEDHRKGTVSKDRPARHHYGNNAKKMEVAWVCYQERARLHNTNCIKVETG